MEKIKVGYITYNEIEMLIDESLAEKLNSEDSDAFSFAIEEIWDRLKTKDPNTEGFSYEDCLCKITNDEETLFIEF